MLKNKEDKTCLLIDKTVPLLDTITSVKTTEKLTKHKDLEIEMWGLKITTVLVSVVMGALGTIKKDMENYCIHELQRITLLSAAHLLRRVKQQLIFLLGYMTYLQFFLDCCLTFS